MENSKISWKLTKSHENLQNVMEINKISWKLTFHGNEKITKSGLIRQVTFLKRFNSYEIFYDRTRKRLPFNTGDYLIEVTA